MQFVKIATAAALAMGVTTFAVAQERVSPNDPLNRSAPAARAGSDHDTLPGNAAPSNANPSTSSPSNMNSTSGATGDATGSDSRAGADHNAKPGNAAAPRNPNMNSGATGSAGQNVQITEKNIGPMLQAQGYTDVKSIKRSGDTISADAKKDGKSVKLKVDAKTGKVNESRT